TRGPASRAGGIDVGFGPFRRVGFAGSAVDLPGELSISAVDLVHAIFVAHGIGSAAVDFHEESIRGVDFGAGAPVGQGRDFHVVDLTRKGSGVGQGRVGAVS